MGKVSPSIYLSTSHQYLSIYLSIWNLSERWESLSWTVDGPRTSRSKLLPRKKNRDKDEFHGLVRIRLNKISQTKWWKCLGFPPRKMTLGGGLYYSYCPSVRLSVCLSVSNISFLYHISPVHLFTLV